MAGRPPEETTGRLRRWTLPASYPTAVLLLLFGMVGALLAWLSVDLLTQAMSNLSFLQRHGAAAVAEGGLWQTTALLSKAAGVLMLYLGFRGIESELLFRWLHRGGD
jgi:hypothetical protein